MNANLNLSERTRQVRKSTLSPSVEIAHHSGMEPTADEMRAWVRDLLAQKNLMPTQLAKKSGIAASTLTRFLDGNGMLSFRTAAKIAHATGVRLPMAQAQDAPAQSAGFAETEGEPFDYQKSARPRTRIDGAIFALIGDRPAADPWRLLATSIEDAGYFPGDILIVDLNAKPQRGAIVCAQVYDWRKGTAETVFRIFEPPYLVVAGRTLQSRKPYLVDNEAVVIKGVVTDMVRVTEQTDEKTGTY